MKKLSLEKMEEIEGGIALPDLNYVQCAVSYLQAVDGATQEEIAIINSLFQNSPCGVYM